MGENCHFVSLWVILQAQNVRKFFECVGLLKGEVTGTLRAQLYFLCWQRYLPWSLQGDNNTYKGHKQNRKAEVGARVFTRNTDCTILKRVIQMVFKKIVLRNGNSSSLPPCHFFRVPSLLAVHLSSQAPPLGKEPLDKIEIHWDRSRHPKKSFGPKNGHFRPIKVKILEPKNFVEFLNNSLPRTRSTSFSKQPISTFIAPNKTVTHKRSHHRDWIVHNGKNIHSF